jgi:hypothetical protein
LQCGRNASELARWSALHGGETYEDFMKNVLSNKFNLQIKNIRKDVNDIAVGYLDASLKIMLENNYFENMTFPQMIALNGDTTSHELYNGVTITIIPGCKFVYSKDNSGKEVEKSVNRTEKEIANLKLVKDLAKRFNKTGKKEIVIFNDGGHWSTVTILMKKNKKDIGTVGLDSSSSAKRVRVCNAILRAIQVA